MKFGFIGLGGYLTASALLYTLSIGGSWAGESGPLGERPDRFELTAQAAATASESAESKAQASEGASEKAGRKAKSKNGGKKDSSRKGFTSKKDYKKPGEDTQVDFIDSEDGYWNSRGINDPTLTGSGSSLNSVMFESRGGRRVQALPAGLVHDSDVEVTGGQKTEVTINGRRVTEAEIEQKVSPEREK